jgi:hypothetical protein
MTSPITVEMVREVRAHAYDQHDQHTIDMCNCAIWSADANGVITSITYVTDYVRGCVIARDDARMDGRL